METIADNEPGSSVLKEMHRIYESTPQVKIASRWFGISPITSDTKPWIQGYVGEEITAATLKPLLKKGWKVYHSVPVGKKGSDIDHVVVSPKNVIFVLNTKNHQEKSIWVAEKQIRVNGQPQPYIRNSQYEASRVHKKTGTPVIPVLVFVNANLFNIKPGAEKNGVIIAAPGNLVKQLTQADNAHTETYVLPEKFEDPSFWAEAYEDTNTGHKNRLQLLKKLQSSHSIAMTMRTLYSIFGLSLGLSALVWFTSGGF